MLYVVGATAWIALGGVVEAAIAARTTFDPVAIAVARGLLFVVVTALLLRIVLRRYAQRLADAADAERRAAARLQEVSRIRASFLRGISHELRTPLTNILGYGLTLNDHLRRLDLDTAEHLTQRLVTNARKFEKLVLDLLDVDERSKVDEQVTPEPVRLDLMLRDVIDRIPRSGHTIHVQAQPLVAHLDRTRTERIVDELLRNAIRHAPQGGNVWVVVGSRGRSVRLTVEDDGPGIDPTLQHELFEPFTQGIHAGESPSPGLGIGLALISQYAALQHGHVDVTASSHGGARFDVVLPRRVPAHALSTAAATHASADVVHVPEVGSGTD